MKKKLIYIANIRLPTEKAHGVNIMNMCREFAHNGYDVELLIPKRQNYILADPFAYYDLPPQFKIFRLPCLDLVGTIPRLGFLIENCSFGLSVLFRLARSQDSILYGRDQITLFMLSFILRKKVYYEIHDVPKRISKWHLYLWQHAAHLFVLNRAIVQALQGAGISTTQMTISPSAVDIKRLMSAPEKAQARNQLGLSQDAFTVVYAGHFYPEKGPAVLLEAALRLPDVQTVIVGGIEPRLSAFRKKAAGHAQIILPGAVSNPEVSVYLAAADVLVIPNSAKYVHSLKHTSPLKLFEYMAARRPIVASRVPAIEEVVSAQEVFFVEPDSPEELARSIQYVRDHPEEAQKKTALAFAAVSESTWEKRARNIISKFS